MKKIEAFFDHPDGPLIKYEEDGWQLGWFTFTRRNWYEFISCTYDEGIGWGWGQSDEDGIRRVLLPAEFLRGESE